MYRHTIMDTYVVLLTKFIYCLIRQYIKDIAKLAETKLLLFLPTYLF